VSPLNNRKKSFSILPFSTVFLFCLIFSVLAGFLFQHFYFPERYADLRVAEMEEVFNEEEFFADRARSVLDTRNDVGYVRLLDNNGVLEKSFGFQDDEGFKKLTIKGPEGKTVLVGIGTSATKKFYFDAVLWSLIFGSLMAVVFTLSIRFISNRAFGFLKELSDAVTSISRGNYSVRLDGQSSKVAGFNVQWLYRQFNEMVSSLESSSIKQEKSGDLGLQDFTEERAGFYPKMVLNQEKTSQISSSETSTDSSNEETEEVIIVSDKEDTEPKKTPSPITDIVDFQGKETELDKMEVSILVIKIVDFESLIKDISPLDIDSLTSDYRKFISSTVNSFGGTVEAILRDEVVAFFTNSNSEEVPASELSCICCAVEVIQLFAGVIDKKRISSQSDIKLKMGISSTNLSVLDKLDVPTRAKTFVDEAKVLCDGARPWSILVTTGFRASVSDYLEVRREKVEDKLCYAVIGVEEEALQQIKK